MGQSRYDQQQIEAGLADIKHIIVKKAGDESKTVKQCRYENGRLIAVGDDKVTYADNGRISHIGDCEVTYENDYIVSVGNLSVSYKSNDDVIQIDKWKSSNGDDYATIEYNKPSVYDRILADRDYRLAVQRYVRYLGGGHSEKNNEVLLQREKLDRKYTARLLAYLKILCDNDSDQKENRGIKEIQNIFKRHCETEDNYKTYPQHSYSNINEARYFFSSLPIERIRALVDDLRAQGSQLYSSGIELLFRGRQASKTNELCGLLSKLYHYGKQSLNGLSAGCQYAETALSFFNEKFPTLFPHNSEMNEEFNKKFR
jgi:hypothetical protein